MALKTTRANIENFRAVSETPPIRCRCGGTFTLGFDEGDEPFGDHSEPTCPAFDAIGTCADLADFSALNAVVTRERPN